MNRPHLEAKLHEMTLEQLAAWYEVEVGYNPVQEDPKLTRAELLRDCQDYQYEAGL